MYVVMVVTVEWGMFPPSGLHTWKRAAKKVDQVHLAAVRLHDNAAQDIVMIPRQTLLAVALTIARIPVCMAVGSPGQTERM